MLLIEKAVLPQVMQGIRTSLNRIVLRRFNDDDVAFGTCDMMLLPIFTHTWLAVFFYESPASLPERSAASQSVRFHHHGTMIPQNKLHHGFR